MRERSTTELNEFCETTVDDQKKRAAEYGISGLR